MKEDFSYDNLLWGGPDLFLNQQPSQPQLVAQAQQPSQAPESLPLHHVLQPHHIYSPQPQLYSPQSQPQLQSSQPQLQSSQPQLQSSQPQLQSSQQNWKTDQIYTGVTDIRTALMMFALRLDQVARSQNNLQLQQAADRERNARNFEKIYTTLVGFLNDDEHRTGDSHMGDDVEEGEEVDERDKRG